VRTIDKDDPNFEDLRKVGYESYRPSHPVLQRPFNVFAVTITSNIRVEDLLSMIFVLATNGQMIRDNVVCKHYGTLEPSDEPSLLKYEQITGEILKEIAEKFESVRLRNDPLDDEPPEMTFNYQVTRGMADAAIPLARHALSLSMAVLAWTAFETLFHDVWIAVLNRYPRPHADRVLDIRSGQATDDTRGKLTVGITKALRMYEYDLRTHMGSVLKSGFNFARFDSIKKAYAAAFGDPLVNILEDQSYPIPLKACEAVRNVLVHRAGMIDTNFLERVSDVARFQKLKVGDSVWDAKPVAVPLFQSICSASASMLECLDKTLPREETTE
jgi:hypothetical protein